MKWFSTFWFDSDATFADREPTLSSSLSHTGQRHNSFPIRWERICWKDGGYVGESVLFNSVYGNWLPLLCFGSMRILLISSSTNIALVFTCSAKCNDGSAEEKWNLVHLSPSRRIIWRHATSFCGVSAGCCVCSITANGTSVSKTQDHRSGLQLPETCW
jgi:hypothetical protein